MNLGAFLSFPDFFSEAVKNPRKGKRWTQDDIYIVQSIRQLHNERKGNEKIKALLKDGYTVPIYSAAATAELNRILAASWDMLEQCDKLLKESKIELFRSKWFNEKASREQPFVLNHIEEHHTIERELRRIRLFLRRPISEGHRRDFNWEWQEFRREVALKYIAEAGGVDKVNEYQSPPGLSETPD